MRTDLAERCEVVHVAVEQRDLDEGRLAEPVRERVDLGALALGDGPQLGDVRPERCEHVPAGGGRLGGPPSCGVGTVGTVGTVVGEGADPTTNGASEPRGVRANTARPTSATPAAPVSSAVTRATVLGRSATSAAR